MRTIGRPEADDADAVGAGVDDTAAVGPGLADNETVAGGLGISDGPTVHELTTSAMAATSRPKPRLMSEMLEARLGDRIRGGAAGRDGDQCDRPGGRASPSRFLSTATRGCRVVAHEPPVGGKDEYVAPRAGRCLANSMGLACQSEPPAVVLDEPSCYHFRVFDPRLPLRVRP